MKLFLFLTLLWTSVCSAQDYSRSEWRHWSDFDADCQNTRQEILISTSLVPVSFTSSGCTVAFGEWVGPYTGQAFYSARDLDLDHVIPLKYAHEHSGASWSPLLKKVFANDPENLLLVSLSENRSKGAKGPAEYMPKENLQCDYALRWKFLASKYELELSTDDTRVLNNILRGCK